MDVPTSFICPWEKRKEQRSDGERITPSSTSLATAADCVTQELTPPWSFTESVWIIFSSYFGSYPPKKPPRMSRLKLRSSLSSMSCFPASSPPRMDLISCSIDFIYLLIYEFLQKLGVALQMHHDLRIVHLHLIDAIFDALRIVLDMIHVVINRSFEESNHLPHEEGECSADRDGDEFSYQLDRIFGHIMAPQAEIPRSPVSLF